MSQRIVIFSMGHWCTCDTCKGMGLWTDAPLQPWTAAMHYATLSRISQAPYWEPYVKKRRVSQQT